MVPFKNESLPSFFRAGGRSYECIVKDDFFKGSRVFMIAHSENDEQMMFQKQYGSDAMEKLIRVKMMERI